MEAVGIGLQVLGGAISAIAGCSSLVFITGMASITF